MVRTAERVGFEPTHGRPPAYRRSRAAPCPAWVSLLDGRPGRASGGRESRTPRPARAGRPRSRRVGSPHARALHDRRRCTPGCGPDQVRTGGLRLDGATGTPLPYEAVHPPRFRWDCWPPLRGWRPGTPPGGRTLTTRLRAWHAGHYVRGVLVGATGLAPVGPSEAALQAAAFAARPHPHDGSGRGGPTAVWFLASLHRWLVSSG